MKEAVRHPVFDAPPAPGEIRFIPGGDIFDSKCKYLVNPVNCIGVSGVLAGQFADNFPDMEKFYRGVCKPSGYGPLQPGTIFPYYAIPDSGDPNVILFPTMRFPGQDALMTDILQGLFSLRDFIKRWSPGSIAFPMLGCGVGRLPWELVGTSILLAIADLPTGIELYGPEISKYCYKPVRSMPPDAYRRPGTRHLGNNYDGGA